MCYQRPRNEWHRRSLLGFPVIRWNACGVNKRKFEDRRPALVEVYRVGQPAQAGHLQQIDRGIRHVRQRTKRARQLLLDPRDTPPMAVGDLPDSLTLEVADLLIFDGGHRLLLRADPEDHRQVLGLLGVKQPERSRGGAVFGFLCRRRVTGRD